MSNNIFLIRILINFNVDIVLDLAAPIFALIPILQNVFGIKEEFAFLYVEGTAVGNFLLSWTYCQYLNVQKYSKMDEHGKNARKSRNGSRERSFINLSFGESFTGLQNYIWFCFCTLKFFKRGLYPHWVLERKQDIYNWRKETKRQEQ